MSEEYQIQYKQFVIVPKKPKMSPGKIASQVAHATFMALETQREIIFKSTGKYEPGQDNIINTWKKTGQCVIVLECPTQIELMNIARYCEQWKIPSFLYIDEGLTEIPMGTATAFATGVLPKKMHWMFSCLKLYNDKPKSKSKKKGLFRRKR